MMKDKNINRSGSSRVLRPTKQYAVFRIDICFTGYAIDYVLVGAESIEDLLAHMHEIFEENEIDYGTTSVDEITSDRIKEVKGLFTNTPYIKLDSYRYYE